MTHNPPPSWNLLAAYRAIYIARPRNAAWAGAHGLTDIERDGHRIEVVIEKRSVLVLRFTVVNNGLGGYLP